MDTKTAKFNIYKKSAAAQMSLMRPAFNDKGFITKEGGILFELAQPLGADANGNTTYNWVDKINFALGMNDLCLLGSDFTTRLVHEYQGKVKALQFTAGKDKYEGTYMLKVSETNEQKETRSVSVGVSAGEASVIMRLLAYSTPKILGW